MSRVPPHMKPLRLRQMLEGQAKLGRIYMAPKTSAAGTSKKKVGGKAAERGKEYGEAWIEFEDKKLGRAVAELLNGQAMGGKHRSKYHDDLWTLKYLPKFKWDHLTEEIGAYRCLCFHNYMKCVLDTLIQKRSLLENGNKLYGRD